jgi:AcrR family transcriptional regulator
MPAMPNRCRILDAARKVFGEYGFRGATTRRIAQEAGVNEVTLFRTFGSKAALIAEAVNAAALEGGATSLPEVPDDPERELTLWCRGQLAHLRASSALIRKTMSEAEERPELSSCAVDGPTRASQQLTAYITRLRRQGRTSGEFPTQAAAAMLLGALFADAMGRDMMPQIFPQPTEAAPRIYTRLFLRTIGLDGESSMAAKLPHKGTAARKAAR